MQSKMNNTNIERLAVGIKLTILLLNKSFPTSRIMVFSYPGEMK